MCDIQEDEDLDSIPLPKGWSQSVRHAVLNVIGIAQFAILEPMV